MTRLYDNNTIQAEGERTTIQTYPCGPITPKLIQLHATTNCGGAEKCVVVSWSMLDQPEISYPVDHLILRKYFFGSSDWQEKEFILDANQSNYFDTDVYDNRAIEYHLKSVSSNGLQSYETKLNIRTPWPGDPWDVISTDWQDSR